MRECKEEGANKENGQCRIRQQEVTTAPRKRGRRGRRKEGSRERNREDRRENPFSPSLVDKGCAVPRRKRLSFERLYFEKGKRKDCSLRACAFVGTPSLRRSWKKAARSHAAKGCPLRDYTLNKKGLFFSRLCFRLGGPRPCSISQRSPPVRSTHKAAWGTRVGTRGLFPPVAGVSCQPYAVAG